MGKMIRNYWENFTAWLAFKLFPELEMYIKVAKRLGEVKENERIVELIEQSNLRNKKAVIDLVEIKYTRLNIESIKQTLDDASEDQKSSDAS